MIEPDSWNASSEFDHAQVEMVAPDSQGGEPSGKYDDTAFTIVETGNQHKTI